MHPSEVLFQGQQQPVSLPACDHYAGAETLMRKSLLLQREMGPVFDVTLDCEDGAAAGNEAAHAALIGALIASDENHFDRVGVRVHDLHHPFFERDIEAVCERAANRVAYIALPKAAGVQEVEQAIGVINYHAGRTGRGNMPVHVLVETQGAVAAAFAIAALPQVQVLSFGIMDFVSSHYGAIPGSAMRSPGQFGHPLVMRAKLEIAAACHAHGKVPSHNVTTELNDPSVVASDAARAAAECGYTRMWSIHPAQIRPILKSFAPRISEINEAAAILSNARAAQWGPTQHHGKLHDRASYRYYWTVLQRAKAGGLPLPTSAADLL